MSDKLTIELMRSQRKIGGKYYLALGIDGLRHGPDAGPWHTIQEFRVDAGDLTVVKGLRALNTELLSLVKKARDGLIAERQAHYDNCTNSEGEYTDPDDADIEADIREEIAHYEAVIAKAEDVDT